MCVHPSCPQGLKPRTDCRIVLSICPRCGTHVFDCVCVCVCLSQQTASHVSYKDSSRGLWVLQAQARVAAVCICVNCCTQLTSNHIVGAFCRLFCGCRPCCEVHLMRSKCVPSRTGTVRNWSLVRTFCGSMKMCQCVLGKEWILAPATQQVVSAPQKI